MGKVMDMIYANSQCAGIYYQIFDMNELKENAYHIDVSDNFHTNSRQHDKHNN